MAELLFDKQGDIALITFNRPAKRNALTPEMMVRLAHAWVEFRDDDDLRVSILTGTGTVFCAGADLARLIPLLTRARAPEDEWDTALIKDRSVYQTAILRRFELYKPVIAAINGAALAGGTEIVEATDIRLTVPQASFGLTEPRHGLVPSGGSMVRLARQIPYCKAMEILLTGDSISAQEALRIGLVNEIVPSDRLLERAFEVARRIVTSGPLAIRKIKETVLRSSGRPLNDAFTIEDEIAREIARSADAREGPRAFVEKRVPHFIGR